MGLHGMDGLRELRQAMSDLARVDARPQREINFGVARELRAVVKEEFATGSGPFGDWAETKRGRAALVSKKLPQTFEVFVIPGGVYGFFGLAWLEAQHYGHTFPARQVGANKQHLTFSKSGKLVREARVFNKKGEVKRGYYQTFAKEHSVRARVLKPRPLFPEQDMPAKWGDRINAAAERGLQAWHDRAPGSVR